MAGRSSAALGPLQTLFQVGAIGALGDGQLLQIFAARSDALAAEAAFATLVDRHGPTVLRVCRDVLGDQHAAEDTFQATFLVLARRARSIRKADSVASWLFGVARRVAAKARAEAAHRRAKERKGAEMSARRTDSTGEANAWRELYEELDRLPEKYRAPLVLCHLAGLTYEQAATQLKCPVRTVQIRLIRGRERLRGMLVRRGLGPAAGALGVALAAEPARAAVTASLAEMTTRAALPFAAGRAAGTVSPSALSLAEGILETMLIYKLKFVTACIGATAGIVVLGGMLQAQVAPRPARALPSSAAPRADRDALQGRWSATMPGPGGQKQTLIWNIEGDRIAMQVVMPDGTAQEVLKGQLEIDANARPRRLAIKDATGPDGRNQRDNLGIYELIGDTLKICYGTPGQARPKVFKQGESGPPMLMSLKRGGPEAKAASPRASAPAPGESVEVSGRVLGPDGRPHASAKIYFFRPDDARAGEEPRPADLAECEVRASSGPDGRFQFRVTAAEFAGIDSAFPFSQPTISAVAKGYGPGWVHCASAASASDVTLNLVKDDVPIAGRVLNLEGQPIAGANVRVLALLGVYGDDSGPVLRIFRASPAPLEILQRVEKRLDRLASGLVESVRTGPDGRFRLTGAGRGRIVELRIDGPGIATQKWVDVFTNPSPLADPRDAVKTPEPQITLSMNPTFEFHAGPTQPVEGVVRDKDTGKPLSGVVVKSEMLATFPMIANDYVRTTTDEQGRYRLLGLPKGPGHMILAVPAEGQPYLAALAQVGSAPGVEPVKVDIALKRGILVRGRVTRGKDGRPVRARVEYFAEYSNPQANNALGFTGTRNAVPTRPDGSFAVAALPGRGMLAVRAEGNQFPTADRQSGLKPTEFLIEAWPYHLQRIQFHAIVRVAPRADEREVTCDVVLGKSDKALSSSRGGGRGR